MGRSLTTLYQQCREHIRGRTMEDQSRTADHPTGPSSLFDLTGRTLGKYRLVEKLGQGGMAQVYKAYQPDLDRYVAIKVLHPHLTGDPDFAARFRREARAIAALEHPNIVRVYDFDTAEGLGFLVMEYLEGENLKQRLYRLGCEGKRMDLAQVTEIVSVLTDALDYAHRQGLVHRDVKPSNVLLTASGRPVLTDFGIARMVDITTITESGGTLGTPAYMSPEQGRGEPGDARSDIYALGAMLYQMCTGQLPFDADTPYAVILKHITAPLPLPRSVCPDLPEAVERVILKAMAKDPDDRFQTAGEMGRALQAAVAASTGAPLPAEPSLSPRPLRWAVGALVALVGLVIWCLHLMPFLWGEPVSPTSTVSVVGGMTTVVLSGSDITADTWLNPDLPDEPWHEADLVHLQGPLTPDRVLFRFDLGELPQNVTILSATLTLRVELWGDTAFPGAAVAYRMLVPWEPEVTTYNAPWAAPGLVAGVDYDPTPLDVTPVPDEGLLTFDVHQAAEAWLERGAPNYGIVVMMSEDSHNQAHHWVYMSEQADPTDRPALHIAYRIPKL